MKIITATILFVLAFAAHTAANALPGEGHQVLVYTVSALVALGLALIVTTGAYWQFFFDAPWAGMFVLLMGACAVEALGSGFGAFAGVYYAGVVLTVIAVAAVQWALGKYHVAHCSLGSACRRPCHDM